MWDFKLFRRMIVDSHQHVFHLGRDDAGLVADMDAHGIDLAWLLTWDMAPNETRPGYENFFSGSNPPRVLSLTSSSFTHRRLSNGSSCSVRLPAPG